MTLNFLESTGAVTLLIMVFFAMVVLYYLIKDAINAWKLHHRNKCPFCGAYLHGYHYIYMGAKHDARYCSRCGRSLNKTENIFDPIKFGKELKTLLSCSNEYRERVKRLGCESCIYFRNQCYAISGEFIPGIFENECKHRKEVIDDLKEVDE